MTDRPIGGLEPSGKSTVEAWDKPKKSRRCQAFMGAINLAEKLTKISDLWSPRVVAEMNDYQFKLAKLEGEFFVVEVRTGGLTFIGIL